MASQLHTVDCFFHKSIFFLCALVKWSHTFLWLAELKTFSMWPTLVRKRDTLSISGKSIYHFKLKKLWRRTGPFDFRIQRCNYIYRYKMTNTTHHPHGRLVNPGRLPLATDNFPITVSMCKHDIVVGCKTNICDLTYSNQGNPFHSVRFELRQ